MKSMELFKKVNKLAAAGLIICAWWCVFYPELCFTEDTYETVYETQEETREKTQDEARDNDNEKTKGNGAAHKGQPGILEAEDEQIVVKSRLLEWLTEKKD